MVRSRRWTRLQLAAFRGEAHGVGIDPSSGRISSYCDRRLHHRPSPRTVSQPSLTTPASVQDTGPARGEQAKRVAGSGRTDSPTRAIRSAFDTETLRAGSVRLQQVSNGEPICHGCTRTPSAVAGQLMQPPHQRCRDDARLRVPAFGYSRAQTLPPASRLLMRAATLERGRQLEAASAPSAGRRGPGVQSRSRQHPANHLLQRSLRGNGADRGRQRR